MFRRFLLTCGLVVLLAACLPAEPTLLPTLARLPDTATPSATPTLEPTKDQPTVTLTPTIIPTLQDSSPTPQVLPTDTPVPLSTLELIPTLTATAVPQPSVDSGAIQIQSPGPLSKIVGKMSVYGYAVPGYDHKGTLELYGEDGSLLASQLLQLNTPYKWAFFYWDLSFKIRSVGELARLSLTTQDEYGRLTAVNSVHLLLLAEGTTLLNPPGNLQERCVIEKPVAGQRLSGGVLSLSGKMRPFNNLPLTLELVTRDGRVIGTGLVPMEVAPGDAYVPFRIDMAYQVPVSEWVLLEIRQFDDRIGGIMYLYSREFFLNP